MTSAHPCARNSARDQSETTPSTASNRTAQLTAGAQALAEILSGEMAAQDAAATAQRKKIVDGLGRLKPSERIHQERAATFLLSHIVRLRTASAFLDGLSFGAIGAMLSLLEIDDADDGSEHWLTHAAVGKKVTAQCLGCFEDFEATDLHVEAHLQNRALLFCSTCDNGEGAPASEDVAASDGAG